MLFVPVRWTAARAEETAVMTRCRGGPTFRPFSEIRGRAVGDLCANAC